MRSDFLTQCGQTVLCFCLFCVFVFAYMQPAAAQSTLDTIRAEGVVRIAVADEAPYGYRDAAGEISGEGPAIARKVLAMINPDIDIEWTVTEFGKLIQGLQDDQFDIAAAGMFITKERCQEIAFSNPTYVVGEAFVVKAGNPKNLSDYAAVSQHRGAIVGLISGTVEYNYAYVAGIPAERALLYFTLPEAVEALQAGEIDAIGVTTLTARGLVDQVEEGGIATTEQFYPVVDGVVTRGYGAFAFRRADQDLVEAFNTQLATFIGSDEHWSSVEPFGFGPDMAPDKTAAELCSG